MLHAQEQHPVPVGERPGHEEGRDPPVRPGQAAGDEIPQETSHGPAPTGNTGAKQHPGKMTKVTRFKRVTVVLNKN